MRAGAVVLLLLLLGCEREERAVRPPPPEDGAGDEVVLSALVAGPGPPVARTSGRGRDYETNAFHVAEGKRLYGWLNCAGCHGGGGGGGSGPALIDDRWIYGGTIENVVATIREGRPNGMPSFRGKVPDEQIWQVAAYVRSLGRGVRADVAPGRSDDIAAHPPENELPATAPDAGGEVPPSGEATR